MLEGYRRWRGPWPLQALLPAPLWEAVQAGMTRYAAQFLREVESLGPA